MSDENNKKDSFGLLKLSPAMLHKLKRYGVDDPQAFSAAWEQSFVNPLQRHFEQYDQDFKSQKSECDRKKAILNVSSNKLKRLMTTLTKRDENQNSVHQVGVSFKEYANNKKLYEASETAFKTKTDKLETEFFEKIDAINKSSNDVASKLSQLGKINFGLLEGLTTEQLLESIDHLEGHKLYLSSAHNKASWWRWVFFWRHKEYTQDRNQFSILLRNLGQVEITLRILAIKHYLRISQAKSPIQEDTHEATLLARDIEQLLAKDIEHLKALKSFIRQGGARLGIFKLTNLENFLPWVKSKRASKLNKEIRQHLMAHYKTQSTVIENELNDMCDHAAELGVHQVVDKALASLTAVDPVKEWQDKPDEERQNFITDAIFSNNNVKSIVDPSIHKSLVQMYPEKNKASTSEESNASKHDDSYYDPLVAKVFYCAKILIPELLENSSPVQSSHDNVVLDATIRKLDSHIDTLNKKTKGNFRNQEVTKLKALKAKLQSRKAINNEQFSEQDVIKICQMNHGFHGKKFKKSMNDWWDKLDAKKQEDFCKELNGAQNASQNSRAQLSEVNDSLWESGLLAKAHERKIQKGNESTDDQQNNFSSLGKEAQHAVKQMAYVHFAVFGLSGDEETQQTELEAFCDFLQLSCHRYSAKGMMHGIRDWFGNDQKKPLILKREKEIDGIKSLNDKLSNSVQHQSKNQRDQDKPEFNYNFSEAEIDLLIKAYAQYKRLHSDDNRMDLINNMCQSGLTEEKRRQFLDTLAQGFNRILHEVVSGKKTEKEDVLQDAVDALTTEGSIGSSKLLTSSITEKSSQDSSRFFYHVKEDIQSMISSMKRFFVSDERSKHRKIYHTQRKVTRYFEGLFNELQLGNVQCGNLILLDGSEASQCSKAVSSSSKETCGIEEVMVAGKLPSQCDSLVQGLAGNNEDDRVVEKSIVDKFHKAFFKQVVKKYSSLASTQDFSQINQEDLRKLLSMIILNRLPDEKNKAFQNDSDGSQTEILSIKLNDAMFKKLRKTFRKFVKKQIMNSGCKKAMTSTSGQNEGEQDLHRNFRDRKQYQLFASILHEYTYSNENNPESILRMNDLLKLNLTTVADFILHVNRKGNNGKYISPWISKDISLLHLAKKNAMVLHALKNKQVALKKLFSPSERKKWIKVCQWARDLARGEQSAYIPAGEDGSFWKSTKKQQNCVELLVKYGNADSQKTVNDYIGVASNKTQENATNIKNEDDSLVLYYLNQRLHELKEQYNSEGLSEAWKLDMNHLFELAKCAKKSLSTELLNGDIKENMELFLNNHEVSKTKQKKLKDAIREISHADPIGQPETSTINASYRSTKKSLEEFAQDFTVDEAKRIHAVTMLVGLPEDDLFSKSFKDAVNMFELSKEARSLSPWLSLIQNGDQNSKLSIEGVMNEAGLLGKNPVLHKRFKEQFPAITEHVYKQMSDWLFRYIQGNLSKQAFDVFLPYVQNTQNIPLIQSYYAQAFSAVIQDGVTSQLKLDLERNWDNCMAAYIQAMKINGKPELASQYKVLDKVLLSILSVKLPLNETPTSFNEAEQFSKKALKLWQLMADASAYTKNDKSLKSFSQFHETQEYLRQLWFRAFILSHGDGGLVIDNEKSNSNNKPEEMLSRSFYHQDFERSTETQKILSKQIYDENIKLNDTLVTAYASPSNLCTLEKWGESNVDKRDGNWHLAHKYLRNQRVQQINNLLSRPKQDFGSNRIIKYCELIRNHSESLIMKNQSAENKKLLNQVVSEIGAEVANSVENTTRAIAGGVGITPDFIRPNLVSTALGNDGYKAISKSLDSFVQDFELLSTQHDQKSQNEDQTYQNTYKKPFDALKFFDTFATKKQWSDLFSKILEQLLDANNKDQIELLISGFQRSKEWTHFELLSLRDDQKRKDVDDGALDEVSQKTSRSPDPILSQRYQVAYSKFSSDCFKNAQTQWSVQREYLFHAFADDKELFAFRIGKMQSILDEAKVHDSLIGYLKVLTLLNGSINQEKENATARLMPHDLTKAHQILVDQTLNAHIRKSLAVVSGASNPNELAEQEIYRYGHSLFKIVEQWSQNNVLQSSARLLFLKHLVVDQPLKESHLDSIQSYNKTNCLDDQNQDNIYLNAGDVAHFIGYLQAIMEKEGEEFSKDVSRISAWCNLLDKHIQCHDEQAKYAKEHFSKALKFKRFVHLLVHSKDYAGQAEDRIGQDDCLFGKGSEVIDAKKVFNLESNEERKDFSQDLLDVVKGTLQDRDEIFKQWYKIYLKPQLKNKLDKIREELGKDTEEKKPESIKVLHDVLDRCYKKHPVDNRRAVWINDLRENQSQSNFNVEIIEGYFNKHHINDASLRIKELNAIVSMTQGNNQGSLWHAMGFCKQWKMVEKQEDIKSQHSEIQKVLARGESFIAELEKIEEKFITDNEIVDLSSLRPCFRDELSTVRVNAVHKEAPLMTAIARLFRDPTEGLGQEAIKADQKLIGHELEKGKVYLPSAKYFTNRPNMAIYWLKALPELYERRFFEAKKEAINSYVKAFCDGFLPNNQGEEDSQHENTLTAVQEKELTDLKSFILNDIDSWQQKSNPIRDSSGNSSQSDSKSSVPGGPNKTSPKVKVKPKRESGLENDARKMMEDLAKDSNVDLDLIVQMEASNSAMQHQIREIQERKILMAEQAKSKKKTSQNAANLKGSPSKAGMHGSGSANNRSNQSQDEIKKRESTTDSKSETPLGRGVTRMVDRRGGK